ncbi:MAG: neutral/alkaline non-lysosomal ceramidase N-terminal domain-containing protein, partial [Bacteroidota bacterium]
MVGLLAGWLGSAHAQFQAGAARVAMEVFHPGVGMYGYGQMDQRAAAQRTPLHARALIIKDSAGGVVAMVNCELAYITHGIKTAVVQRLAQEHPQWGIGDANLMITATHTHSGPGGFAHYPLYNWTVVGFHAGTFDGIVNGIVKALTEAYQRLEPVRLFTGQAAFHPDTAVAYNRSLKAYNRNPEVTPKNRDEAHLAINRTMDLLTVKSMAGQPLAMFTWLGAHATSIGNDNKELSFDNKGFAAHYLEQEFKDSLVAVFAQSAAGDVSSNYHGPKQWKLRQQRHGEADHEEAASNGSRQFRHALNAYRQGRVAQPVQGAIRHALAYADFSALEIDTAFTGGVNGAVTGPASFGVAFMRGTPVDGRGVGAVPGRFLIWTTDVVKGFRWTRSRFQTREKRLALNRLYRSQGRKKIFAEAGNKRILGTHRIGSLAVPGFTDPVVRVIKEQYRDSALQEHSWAPQVLPIQLFQLGNVAILGVPGEITTIGAERLIATVRPQLEAQGVQHIILSAYANAYMGYITTREEYRCQRYEGGHTLY